MQYMALELISSKYFVLQNMISRYKQYSQVYYQQIEKQIE